MISVFQVLLLSESESARFEPLYNTSLILLKIKLTGMQVTKAGPEGLMEAATGGAFISLCCTAMDDSILVFRGRDPPFFRGLLLLADALDAKGLLLVTRFF